MAPTKKLHYAWIVLGAACILNIVSRADSASFGVFIDPLVEQFGWKRGDISFAYSLAFIVGLPAVVIMGWLGDRFGAAAARGVVEQVEAIFTAAGFRVARNSPFAGAYISQAYGHPVSNKHVVQVEIDRSLYLDERKVEPLPNFSAFCQRINRVVGELAAIGRQALPIAAE